LTGGTPAGLALAGLALAGLVLTAAGCGDDGPPVPDATPTAEAFHSVAGLCDHVAVEPYLALLGDAGAQLERLSFDAGGGRAGDPWSVCLVVRVAGVTLLPTELVAPEAADGTEGQLLSVKLWIHPDAQAAGAAYLRRLTRHTDAAAATPAPAPGGGAPGFETASRLTSVRDIKLDRVATTALLGHRGNGLFEIEFTETCPTCRSLLGDRRDAWRPTVPAERVFPLLEATATALTEKARG
jgi:hypothetical protein